MEKFNDVINSNKLTLVDFYATWCGPCKMMHPVLEQLKADLGDSIRIIKLDVDKSGTLPRHTAYSRYPHLCSSVEERCCGDRAEPCGLPN